MNEVPKDTQERLYPGRYLITRTLSIDGVQFRSSVECNNPAFGLRRLGEWEDDVQAKAERNSKKAA